MLGVIVELGVPEFEVPEFEVLTFDVPDCEVLDCRGPEDAGVEEAGRPGSDSVSDGTDDPVREVAGPRSSPTVSAASATVGIASSTLVFVQSFQGWNQARPNASAATTTKAVIELPIRCRRTKRTSPIGPG